MVTKSSLLVVDDTPSNIAVVVETLGKDYTIRVATNGPAALKSAKKTRPDLILLDIMMPEMNGFEVCRQLKQDPALRDVPVIFLTALTDGADEALGLELGAVDYVTKPFNPPILKARVRNHLDLKHHRDNLAELIEEKTAMLVEAHDRLKALDLARHDYLLAISHELRTPMNGILGIAEIALLELDEELRSEYAPIYERARDRLLTVIDGALMLADLQDENALLQTASVDLNEALARSMDGPMKESFSSRSLSFVAPGPGPRHVLGNGELLAQTMGTLLDIAGKMANPRTTVVADFSEEGAYTVLSIAFESAPLPEELLSGFFDTFSSERTRSSVESLGLAIPLAMQIVKALGGYITIANIPSGVKIDIALSTA